MDALAPLRTSTDRPSLEGSLGDLHPAELLRLLAQTRQTGTLQVLADGPALLTLVDGAVSYATTDPSRTLRDVLFVDGVIDDPTWDEATAIEGEELGEALVTVGVPADIVRDAVRRAVLDVVLDLSLTATGRFRFVAGRRHTLGERFHYKPDELDRDLADLLGQWELIRGVVPSFHLVPRVAPSLPPGRSSVTISAADWRVLATLDGTRTVDELRTNLKTTRFAFARTIAALVDAGVVELVGATATEPSGVASAGVGVD